MRRSHISCPLCRTNLGNTGIILVYLLKTKESRKKTKYWIAKATGVHKQTVYNTIHLLKATHRLRETPIGKSRVGLTIRAYDLTPDAAEFVKRIVGGSQ